MYNISEYSQNPIMIIGTGRCGTTLLSSMLNCHPNIAVPPESFFWNTFTNLMSYYGDLTKPDKLHSFIDDVLSTPQISIWSPKVTREQILQNLENPTMCGVFRSLMVSWAKLNNKSLWGDNTPQNIYYWKEIQQCIPDIKVIHIVRDGRDVALSYINSRFGPKTVYSAATHWTYCLDKIINIRSSIPVQQFHELRYEELLTNPEDSLKQICKFLNEDYSADMLSFYSNPIHYSSNVYDLEHKNISKPLIKNNVNKWQNQMTGNDIRIFESIGWRELSKFRYNLVSQNRALSKKELIYIKFVVDPIKKLFAMLSNTTGQREALQYLKIKIRLRLRYLIDS